jgi:hypothetical protein
MLTVHVSQGDIQRNAKDRQDRPVLHLRFHTGQVIAAHHVEVHGVCKIEQRGPCSAHLVIDDPQAVVKAFRRANPNGPLEPVPLPGQRPPVPPTNKSA